MSKRMTPRKTRIRKAGSYADNVKRSESNETKQAQIEAMLNGQRFVDEWNLERVGEKDMSDQDIKPHFDNIQLEDGLIIQMYLESPIKQIVRRKDTLDVTHLDYYIRQIDARISNTDKPNWVPTPFPVIDKGVIVAMSPRTKLWYYEQKANLAKYDPIAAEKMLIPEVGDVVYTKHFMLKDKRYYPDKQKKCEDFVKNQTEIRLNQFNFFFLIDNYDIESLVKKECAHLMDDVQLPLEFRYIDIDVDLDVADESDENIELSEE